MKVFISWSGERSKLLAHNLRDWIPLVLHYVDPWLSEADIAAGERWAESVAKELEASNFGIICVTRENAGSPWVLFEAGALAKSLQGSKVIPLLLDLEFRDITGPLAQFQAKKVEVSGIGEVIHSINQTANHEVPEGRAKQLFDALWPEFEKKVSSIPQQATPAKHTRSQHEVLEELVASVRSLDSRFREVAEASPRSSRYKSRRFHPMMMHDLSEMMGEKPGDPIILLIMSSMFKEEMPWLYELGIEAYRAADAGKSEEAKHSLSRFKRALKVSLHGPFVMKEDFGFDQKYLEIVMHELDRFLMREPQNEDESLKKPLLRRKPK
jgi:hypothetical protein